MNFTYDYKTVKLLPIRPKPRISRKCYEYPGINVELKLEIKLVAKKYQTEWRIEIFQVGDRISINKNMPNNNNITSFTAFK